MTTKDRQDQVARLESDLTQPPTTAPVAVTAFSTPVAISKLVPIKPIAVKPANMQQMMQPNYNQYL